MIKRFSAIIAPLALSVMLALPASAATVLSFGGNDADLNPDTNALIDTHTGFQCSPFPAPPAYTNAFLIVNVIQTRGDGQNVFGFGFLNIGTIQCDGVVKDYAIDNVFGFNNEGLGWEVGDAVQLSTINLSSGGTTTVLRSTDVIAIS